MSKKRVGITWHLREVMAQSGLYATTDLIPLLAERGVELSREQVYRLVTTQPERINVYTLAALCDIFDVGVEALITPVIETASVKKKQTASGETTKGVGVLRPKPARVVKTSRRSP